MRRCGYLKEHAPPSNPQQCKFVSAAGAAATRRDAAALLSLSISRALVITIYLHSLYERVAGGFALFPYTTSSGIRTGVQFFSTDEYGAVLSSCQLAIAKKDMNGKHEHYIVDKLRKFAMSSV